MMDRTGFTRDIPLEAEILTLDRDKIGTVREIQGDFFKVDAPMQPDYWLPMSCVSTVTGTEVLLNFVKDRLGDHKLSAPRAA